nr:MAG TPA: hypothetical protein [Caudoviricetes sp.]
MILIWTAALADPVPGQMYCPFYLPFLTCI